MVCGNLDVVAGEATRFGVSLELQYQPAVRMVNNGVPRRQTFIRSEGVTIRVLQRPAQIGVVVHELHDVTVVRFSYPHRVLLQELTSVQGLVSHFPNYMRTSHLHPYFICTHNLNNRALVCLRTKIN